MGLLSKWVESLDYEYEILTSCTRHLSPRSTCSKCVDACRENAIILNDGKPVINNRKCRECGACISACPVQAVAGIFPRRKMFKNHLVATKHEVPTVKELLVYYKKGVTSIICEVPPISQAWEETIDKVNEILQTLNEPLFSINYMELKAEERKYTRRDLFFSWKDDTQAIMKEMTPAKWRFNYKDLDLVKYYPDYQFTEISLEPSKCTMCKICQSLCKKKCYSITDNHFIISALNCSSCRLCEDACPEKAIKIEEKVMPYVRREFPVYERLCSSCNKVFHTLTESDEKCVPCIKRKGFLSSH